MLLSILFIYCGIRIKMDGLDFIFKRAMVFFVKLLLRDIPRDKGMIFYV